MNRFIIATLAILSATFASASDYRMIVRIKPGCTSADAAEAAASFGGTLIDSTPNAPFALISVPDDPLTLTVVQLQIALGIVDVLWQGDDATLWSAESVSRGSSLSVISSGKALSEVGNRQDLLDYNAAPLAQVNWSPSLAGSDGRTVKVAILDGGLSRQQSELWDKVDAHIDVFNGNADDAPMGRDSNGDGIYDEGVGHGTMVAGLINTVAPKVRFVIAKVSDSDGRASAWGIVKGLAFAVGQGAEVANVSIGSEEVVPAFSAAADWAKSRGLLIVAAIGNAGVDHAWYPSRDSGTLCVAGLGGDDTKADFSNYDARTTAGAPAKGLISQFWDGGLAKWSGTSFAAPFVSAAIADCLRRTTIKLPDFLIGCATQSGRPIDSVNDTAYQGKIGKMLDIQSLNTKILSGTP